MKIPFKQGAYTTTPCWQEVAILALLILFHWLTEPTLLQAVMLWGWFLLLFILYSQVLTPTRVLSLLPFRRMCLKETKATLYMALGETRPGKGILRLHSRRKDMWISLWAASRAERERILTHIKEACLCYTETYVEGNRFGCPVMNRGIYALTDILLLIAVFAGMRCILYTAPALPPEVHAAMERLSGRMSADAERYFLHEWKNADAAKRMGDHLLMASMGKGKKYWGKSFTNEEQTLALDMATDWYHHAAANGSAAAELMLAYLDTMGVPLKDAALVREHAARNFRTLAEQAAADCDISTLSTLQLCYRFGIGTAEDAQKATELLLRIEELKRDSAAGSQNTPADAQEPLDTEEEG